MTDGNWTADDVPDLTGRTVVVTGANNGLGYEATKVFAEKGATVVMACRSMDRAESARSDLLADDPAGDLEILELDLADLDSVRGFAGAFRDAHDELHVLCNNAGVMAIPRQETADGFEKQFGVNHLGHFALTGLLLDRLVETDGESRVVAQSSRVHRRDDIDFDDLDAEESYNKWDAYGHSKLANLLFAYELDRRLDAAGIDDVVSLGCHPGYASTGLQTRGPRQARSILRWIAFKLGNLVVAQSAEKGALPMLYAATAPDVEGGEYVGPDDGMSGYPEKMKSSDRSYDEERAERLWEVSEELTGVEFDLAPRATADD